MLTFAFCPLPGESLLRSFPRVQRNFGQSETCGKTAKGFAKPVVLINVRGSSRAQKGDRVIRQVPSEQDIWFVYDGECPICGMAAAAFEVRKAIGALHLVDARADLAHPALAEVNAVRLDLDAGMAIKYGGRLYHGADALLLMALIGSEHGWLNRMNALLFRNKKAASFAYPFMRAARNLAILLKGSGKIDNLRRSG
jgi:predicted DCC family thiol-disulfide oxidoreductase YuxK